MRLLVYLLILVVGAGVAARLGLLDRLGLSELASQAPDGAELVGMARLVVSALGELPEPFMSMATALAWVIAIGLGLGITLAIIRVVIRFAGWIRDALI